jgi:hypothetical protein
MKSFEYLAGVHAKRFAKAWDYFCIATNAYMAGYKQARDHAKDAYDRDLDNLSYFVFESLGENIVEETIEDGAHQLSIKSFDKWKSEVDNLSFKDKLKALLTSYDFEDVRVDETNGLISFQGTARKK